MDILCGKLAMKLGIPQAITFYIDHQEEIREAKEMEKEKLEDAWVEGFKNWNPSKTFEQYYNETFGGNND